MFFRIFMLCMVLLTPLVMIIFSRKAISFDENQKFDMSKYRRKQNVKGEKEWIYLSGYRTRRSMKNDETYKFAQKLVAKYWYPSGLILLFPSLVTMLLVVGKDKNIIAWTGLAVVAVQMIALLMPIIPVERALKENFDKNGNRIQK